MNNLYDVVGEHHSRPDRLLVIGEDGAYYAWELDTNETRPVELSSEWRVDAELMKQTFQTSEVFAATSVSPAAPAVGPQDRLAPRPAEARNATPMP